MALWCAALCQACGSDVYKPAPIPPATRTVAVYRELPDSLTALVPMPAWEDAEIRTDLDLLILGQQFRGALKQCTGQLYGIRRVYGLPVPDQPPPSNP